MHTFVETSTYLRRAKVLLTEAERDEVVTTIAADPSVGVVIPGTGGFRKARVALQGAGKSGGARVIYYFCGADTPVFLMQIYAKNEKAKVSGAEKVALARVSEEFKRKYRR